MPDYRESQIYQITDTGYNKCYIGSTTQKLYDRMAKHRFDYQRFLQGNQKCANTVYTLFNEFGVENCKIERIEKCPCESKEELLAREGYYIRTTDCVNRCIAGRSHQEHYQDNEEKISKENTQRYYNDKERISEQRKQRRKDNPEKIKEQERQAYQRNKEQRAKARKEKIECECGSVYCRFTFKRHEKTKKHQQYLQNQTNPQE